MSELTPDDPDALEIQLLHLSGLSWFEACTLAGRRMGMSASSIKAMSEALASWYEKELQAYQHEDGRPLRL